VAGPYQSTRSPWSSHLASTRGRELKTELHLGSSLISITSGVEKWLHELYHARVTSQGNRMPLRTLSRVGHQRFLTGICGSFWGEFGAGLSIGRGGPQVLCVSVGVGDSPLYVADKFGEGSEGTLYFLGVQALWQCFLARSGICGCGN
jgi:hypothetical protein